MTEPFIINVGGRSFTTLKSTLEQSPFLSAMLSDQWAGSICHVDGTPFVDRSPLLFEHILNFLRSSVPPIFWTRMNGFDLPLYASLIHEAEYFQLEALTTWIRKEQYINTISITSSMEVITLSDCGHGRSHSGDTEQEFEPGTVSRPGKSNILYKRLLLRKSGLRLPVSSDMVIFTCILANIRCYRRFCNLINAHVALYRVCRTNEADSSPETYFICPVAHAGSRYSIKHLALQYILSVSCMIVRKHGRPQTTHLHQVSRSIDLPRRRHWVPAGSPDAR